MEPVYWAEYSARGPMYGVIEKVDENDEVNNALMYLLKVDSERKVQLYYPQFTKGKISFPESKLKKVDLKKDEKFVLWRPKGPNDHESFKGKIIREDGNDWQVKLLAQKEGDEYAKLPRTRTITCSKSHRNSLFRFADGQTGVSTLGLRPWNYQLLEQKDSVTPSTGSNTDGWRCTKCDYFNKKLQFMTNDACRCCKEPKARRRLMDRLNVR